MTHIVAVEGWGGIRLAVLCSCRTEPLDVIESSRATLAEVSEIAHEHITEAERGNP